MPRDLTKAISELAERTGLSRATIKDLLKAGWTYKESIAAMPAFYSPAYKAKIKGN